MSKAAAEQAFREAAVGCLDGLYAFALSLCRDRAAAEDLVQETYLRALRARHKAAPDAGLRSWLFAILHNVWRNELRRRRPEPLAEHDERLAAGAIQETDPFTLVDRKRAGDRLSAAIDALPGSFREAIVLRCVEGFSYREIAEIVGCPAGTVMSRLGRARAQLRESLRPMLRLATAREER